MPLQLSRPQPNLQRTLSRVGRRVLPILGMLGATLLAGCLSATPTITPGPLQTATPTPLPTATATPPPFGDPANPLVFGVLSSAGTPSANDELLAERLSTASGQAVRVQAYGTYQEILDEMSERRVHIAWMPPLTYLYASRLGIAEVALLANHFGVYEYGAQFLANTASNFTVYYDPVSGQNTTDAPTALAQFAGQRPCWVESGSVSGYIVPAGLLAVNNITVGEPAFTQSHSSVIRSLYVKGVCDFGATFAISGDPRTASAVLEDLPDALERIPIIWRSDAIIPNQSVAYIAGLSEERSKALTAAFLQVAQGPDGLAMLTESAGTYQVDALKAVQDPLYDPLRELVNALKVRPKDLIGR
jgi:phosphonate transport system substrate-binding protein